MSRHSKYLPAENSLQLHPPEHYMHLKYATSHMHLTTSLLYDDAGGHAHEGGYFWPSFAGDGLR